MLSGTLTCRRVCDGRCCAGYTLLELLVTISIVLVLVSVLLPALSSVRGEARRVQCSISQRSVAFDFRLFADDGLFTERGNDEFELPEGRFRLETFQDLQYGISEFWAYGDRAMATLPDSRGRDPMRCPEVAGALRVVRDLPCTGGGVGPFSSISYGFNIRLHLREHEGGPRVFSFVELTGSVLDAGRVPLLWDVDGESALAVSSNPVFSGPSLDSPLLFAGDRYWYPGLRHNGGMNVAFVDGSVSQTSRPLETPWLWGFVPK